MNLRMESPEIVRRYRSLRWAALHLKRALADGDERRAKRAADLVSALDARMDQIAFAEDTSARWHNASRMLQ